MKFIITFITNNAALHSHINVLSLLIENGLGQTTARRPGAEWLPGSCVPGIGVGAHKWSPPIPTDYTTPDKKLNN